MIGGIKIHGRSYRDVVYFFTSHWDDDKQAFTTPPDRYKLFVESVGGGTEVGEALTEDAARKALAFMRRV